MLTEADLMFFRKQRELGILETITESREPEPTLFFTCSDMQRFADKYQHHCKVTATHQHPVIATPGGALILHATSPVAGLFCGEQTSLSEMQKLIFLMQKTHLERLVLCMHWPCAAAGEAQMTPAQAIALLAHTKQHLCRHPELSSVSISARVHIDYTGLRSDMRTYQLKLKRWHAVEAASHAAAIPFPQAARVHY